MNLESLAQRRHLLQSGAGLLFASALPGVFAQSAGTGRMVLVFLRGAYDGLSALVPYADRDYYAMRPNIAIAAPDGSRETALKLNDQFALHPALSALLPLWNEGVLTVIPSAGLPAPNRSHFDAQYLMEIAQSERTNAAMGWLNRLSQNLAADKAEHLLGVGEANPVVLSGVASAKLIPRGEAAQRTGVLSQPKVRQALMDLYAGDDAVSQAFRQGAASRMQTSQELSTERSMNGASGSTQREARRMQNRPENRLDQDGTPVSSAAQIAQMQAASNGAADPVGLALDAQHLATLMRNDRRLRLGFLSAGGWDTHANQGAASGALATNLGNLARGLAQLRQDFNEPGDVILVMSEFGRTAAENGTRGTDHGFGNAMWLIGNRVAGGRSHGLWTGLARGNLNEARDLPAHHDYRSVFAQVLKANFAMSDSQLQNLLPGAQWDNRLDGLMRKI